MASEQDTAPESEVTRLADRLAIHEFIGRYGYDFDEFRLDRWIQSMFVPDVTCTRRIAGRLEEPIHGHDALRERWGNRNPDGGVQGRHVVDSIWIDELTGTDAHVHAHVMILATAEGGPTEVKSVGHYEFDLVKRDGRWWIASWIIGLDRDTAAR
jgi:SnoaL-like domain